MDKPRTAFTLIELLVMVTILVVLLALLAPAMDRAIYQAELAACSANQHAITQSVFAYAMNHKRLYPPHRASQTGNAIPTNISGALSPTNSAQMDMRPTLKTFLAMNRHLNCPLARPVDVEGSGVDTSVSVAYGLWFGWRYYGGQGEEKPMRKLGDRFTWNADAFDVLTGDDDVFFDGDDLGHGTHPDDKGVWANVVFQDQVSDWGPLPLVTYSWWEGTGRGLVDLNYGFQDGAVLRYRGVRGNDDPRLATVPGRNNNNPATTHRRLPAR